MKNLLHKSRLISLIEQRNGYLVLASGLLFLSFILVMIIFYLSGRERVVILPPMVDRPFWLTHSEVSPEYLSQMSTFFAYLRLNVTPESADSQRQILLRYTDPSYYGKLNATLIAEKDRMLDQHMATAFYPVDVKVDSKNLASVITGDLYTSVGSTHLNPDRISYQINYRYKNGRLWVGNFLEVKSHA